MTKEVYNKTKFVGKNRLLSVYLDIIKKEYNKVLSSKEIKSILKDDFNYITTEETIREYYEPNFYELREDITSHLRNMGMNYT